MTIEELQKPVLGPGGRAIHALEDSPNGSRSTANLGGDIGQGQVVLVHMTPESVFYFFHDVSKSDINIIDNIQNVNRITKLFLIEKLLILLELLTFPEKRVNYGRPPLAENKVSDGEAGYVCRRKN